ncbi:MAG: flap endonuclease [Thiotrichaceae bacterium]|nr:flap endonuclease [Thiotrichaceae bacterium]
MSTQNTNEIKRVNRPKALWLIDSSIYIYRAWYTGDESQLDNKGHAIHAYKGFVAFVDDLLTHENPENIAFAFDQAQTQSYRQEIYPDYKKNRKTTPDNLRYQMTLCQQYIDKLGITYSSSNRYEADDIIASWANTSTEVVIVTADKDLTQLICPSDLWCDYGRNHLNYQQIQKKFGVKPEQIADLLALAGDPADNIPGVPMIGIATAAKLLRHFGSLSTLLDSIDKISKMKFRGAHLVKNAIERHQEEVIIYRQLTGLKTNFALKSIQ